MLRRYAHRRKAAHGGSDVGSGLARVSMHGLSGVGFRDVGMSDPDPAGRWRRSDRAPERVALAVEAPDVLPHRTDSVLPATRYLLR